MKEIAQGFAGPFKRLVDEIPDDLEDVTPLGLADWPPLDWESQSNMTLDGYSAHAMTMYRGEGANHRILDAALLIDQLVKVRNGGIDQGKAIEIYEKEMKVRGRAAVLQSRQAALGGHCWDLINDDYPLIGERYDNEIFLYSPTIRTGIGIYSRVCTFPSSIVPSEFPE